jgi:hypothetical protein
LTRLLVWLGAGMLVVLTARTFAYAIEPTPAARLLEHRAGGPALPVLILASLSVGLALAVVVCWLAAFGVRERALLERRRSPQFRVRRAVLSALALGVATSVVGGFFEGYLHWRAGLGWHGLNCLFGPVHRDLLPLEFALSAVAAAVIAAGEHVLAWMRRTFALLRAVPPRVSHAVVPRRPTRFHVPRLELRFAAGSPRAPPVFS